MFKESEGKIVRQKYLKILCLVYHNQSFSSAWHFSNLGKTNFLFFVKNIVHTKSPKEKSKKIIELDFTKSKPYMQLVYVGKLQFTNNGQKLQL